MGTPEMTATGAGIKVQGRVVWALMLRETKTLFGKHKLGYLWAPINTIFTIAIFWAIRSLAGFHPPHGLSTPVFLLGGFIPWYLFSESVGGGLNAIGGNRALLTYPQVFPLDLLAARALLNGAMYFSVLVFLLLMVHLFVYPVVLGNPLLVLAALAVTWLLGFSGGVLGSAANLMWPTTARVVPMLLRALFFVSGLFFSVEASPVYAREFLFFNPLSHLIELTRSGLSWGYGSSFAHWPYVIGFVMVVLALGLLLERYSRHYLDRSP